MVSRLLGFGRTSVARRAINELLRHGLKAKWWWLLLAVCAFITMPLVGTILYVVYDNLWYTSMYLGLIPGIVALDALIRFEDTEGGG